MKAKSKLDKWFNDETNSFVVVAYKLSTTK